MKAFKVIEFFHEVLNCVDLHTAATSPRLHDELQMSHQARNR